MEGQTPLDSMDIYMSELRITSEEKDVLDTENIKPGNKSICHASVKILLDQKGTTIKKAKANWILVDLYP
jgi:hypothetical protein